MFYSKTELLRRRKLYTYNLGANSGIVTATQVCRLWTPI